jgi:hypothetical protein
LSDGRSLYDALGPEFALLRFDRSVSISGLVDAAAQRRVPLVVLNIEAAEARALYARNLVVVRPDQHVAWRGDVEPAACIELIDRLRGASLTTKVRKVANSKDVLGDVSARAALGEIPASRDRQMVAHHQGARGSKRSECARPKVETLRSATRPCAMAAPGLGCAFHTARVNFTRADR